MSLSFHVENLGAIDRLATRFRALINPDATPLMVTWMKIIEDDNKRGVLAGLDKDGNPLAPVTYRPIVPKWDEIKIRSKAAASIRGGTQPNNNLSGWEYRRLGGPPLAPRGRYSRAITNLQTEFDPSARGTGRWEAYGYWREVVSRSGEKFLHYHFHGIGQRRRDLTGVRPEGVEKAKRAAVNWMIDVVRSGGNPASVTAA